MGTKIDVRDNALVLAEYADINNAADGNLANMADNQLTRLHEEWIADKLVDWELDDLPSRVENAVTDLLAYSLGRRNRQLDPVKLQLLREAAIVAESTLYKQIAVPFNGEPVKADYF